MEWKCPECGASSQYRTLTCACGRRDDGAEAVIDETRPLSKAEQRSEDIAFKGLAVVVGSATLGYTFLFIMILHRNEILTAFLVWLAGLAILILCLIPLLKFPLTISLYAGVIVYLLFTLMFTVGVKSVEHEDLSSRVLEKYTEELNITDTPRTRYVVQVTCMACSKKYLAVPVPRSDYRLFKKNERVKIQYVTQSILGIWDIGPVAERINSVVVDNDNGVLGFRGSTCDKIFAGIILLSGIVPLLYLLHLTLQEESA